MSRFRDVERLADPARALRAAKVHTLPRFFRRYIREQYGEDMIEFLVKTVKGEQKFDVPTLAGIVQMAAPSSVRVAAAKAVLDIGLPKVDLVDDDGDMEGAVVLPAQKLREVQAEVTALLVAGRAGDVMTDDGQHYRVEDEYVGPSLGSAVSHNGNGSNGDHHAEGNGQVEPDAPAATNGHKATDVKRAGATRDDETVDPSLVAKIRRQRRAG